MATLLLSNAGAALGAGLFGPVGGTLGRAVGGLAGAAIDQKLFGKDQIVQGPKLSEARIMSSSDGAAMPRLYGRARLGGQLIWATRFEEVTSSQQQCGKGAPGVSVESSAYFGNFAIGICQGPVSHVSRIWADGREIDRTRLEIRVYLGSEDQEPDPLIEAKQGPNNAPAFRGTVYAVFEGFPLEGFGNRIPQFSFEVIRSVARLDRDLRAVTLIPGATEFGLSPVAVEATGSAGTRIVNRNNTTHLTDVEASLDELQALCPNLESVALVVSWFGNDLRAGECRIEPRVEFADSGASWLVSGISRSQAQEVSRIDGRPAYGGTPSDASVLALISDLKSCGLKVVLYPFILMDISADNSLPSPDGGTSQPAHPWRGQITCFPSRNAPGSVDGTQAAESQISAFAGLAQLQDFTAAGSTVQCSANEWSYRRMVLHYAKLCQIAGGVDGFLIGSELPGLSTVRSGGGEFTFVQQLMALALDVRTVLGSETAITYAADWSEYFGYHPQDGSNDLLFHLDPLWALPQINAVGIDNYMPLADWRTGADPGDTQAASQFDPAYLERNIDGGEGHDWFYASPADRATGNRTQITDGLGEPWVWRFKDIESWWGNPHHNRVGGIRDAAPTGWVPKSKPVWFTELGCAAVSMGANQPNVFVDPKSSQSMVPYFSTGARCDLAQNRFLQAHLDHWNGAANPTSPLYGGSMVDPAKIHVWAWDARPFPQFPANNAVWSDGTNWHTGHWLNGRIGGCPLDDLLVAIGADFGFDIEARCDGFFDGLVIPGPASARAVLEPLAITHGLAADDLNGFVRFCGRGYLKQVEISGNEIVEADEGPSMRLERDQETELPQSAELVHADLLAGYEDGHSLSRRLETGSRRTISLQLPAVLPTSTATGLLDAILRDAWTGREKLRLALPPRHAALETGDVIRFQGGAHGKWRIDSIDDGEARHLGLSAYARFDELPAPVSMPLAKATASVAWGKPNISLLNLPFASRAGAAIVHCALDADPWAGSYGLWSSPGENGFALRQTIARRATTGVLLENLNPGPQGRWDRGNAIKVSLRRASLASTTDALVFNGANAAAVLCNNGEWEVVQFASAQLQPDGAWVLRHLLRAQQGTDFAMASGAAEGANFVVLDDGVSQVPLAASESGLTLNWRAGPIADPVSASNFAMLAHAHSPLEKRPFSPAHLTMRPIGGGNMIFQWVRRTRIDGDSWDAAEIPLGENAENYRVEILAANDAVLRSEDAGAPQWAYPASSQLADFGAAPQTIRIRVAQIGNSGLPGSWRSASFNL